MRTVRSPSLGLDAGAEQYQYILRNEPIHLNFGIDVINQIKIENQDLWTKAFQDEVRSTPAKCAYSAGRGYGPCVRGGDNLWVLFPHGRPCIRRDDAKSSRCCVKT